MSVATKPLVLNVDDGAATRYARRRLLLGAGFEVRDAANGSEALAALNEVSPELVILDVGLPDINGYEVCRRIKADPTTASIVVLQVSASFVRTSDRTRALEGGADNFIIEPVEPEVLIATVQAMLRMRGAEEALRRSAQEWQATVEALDEGVALVDVQDSIVRSNRAFREILGESPETLSRSWPEVLGKLGVPSPAVPGETPGRFQRGNRVIQLRETSLASRGEKVVVLTDVSAHVQQLSVAEEANRMKDEFLAVLSHELRSPLNAIVGWTHLLRAGGLDEAGATKAIETIGRNAEVQSRLINEILDVSQVIAGKLRLEPAAIDLAAVVEQTLDAQRPTAEAKRVRLEFHKSPLAAEFAGDANRLQQVVGNLLGNAIKFSPAGGQVTVSLLGDDERVQLVVEDEGPGIPEAFLPYVFDRFRQADSSSTRRRHGLGLGLAIVKHLVELHGGTVAAANLGDRPGAVLTVTLPAHGMRLHAAERAPALELPAGGGELAPVALRGVRVLVVDDESDAREIVSMVLRNAGANVQAAASSAEALALLEHETPDVLLSDLEMPDEDGYTLIRKLRALASPAAALPACALTAYATKDDKRRALEAGFHVHLAKPVPAADLIGVMSALSSMSGQAKR